MEAASSLTEFLNPSVIRRNIRRINQTISDIFCHDTRHILVGLQGRIGQTLSNFPTPKKKLTIAVSRLQFGRWLNTPLSKGLLLFVWRARSKSTGYFRHRGFECMYIFAGVEGSLDANANTSALLASDSYSPKSHGLVPWLSFASFSQTNFPSWHSITAEL